MPDQLPPLNVPALLRKFGLRPDKRLGQNYLVDDRSLQKISHIADIAPDDVILEIGPGLGSLTRVIASQARQVIAVELDTRMLPVLDHVLAPFNNIRLVSGDILKMEVSRLVEGSHYKVVANIPYYITSALIRQLLEESQPPECMVLTVQLEVAERICAEPGDMSLLALSVQVYGQPQISARLPADVFHPPPKVDSAVLKVDIHAQPIISRDLIDIFFRLAKAGFSQKRKNLRNALAGGMGWPRSQSEKLLNAAGIDHRRRAETLSIEEWAQLAILTNHSENNQ